MTLFFQGRAEFGKGMSMVVFLMTIRRLKIWSDSRSHEKGAERQAVRKLPTHSAKIVDLQVLRRSES